MRIPGIFLLRMPTICERECCVFDSEWVRLDICTALGRVFGEAQDRTQGGDISRFNGSLGEILPLVRHRAHYFFSG